MKWPPLTDNENAILAAVRQGYGDEPEICQERATTLGFHGSDGEYVNLIWNLRERGLIDFAPDWSLIALRPSL